MPEGHTIHRLAAEHRRHYGGGPVRLASPQGRFAAGARHLDGHVLEGTDAHGKHLFHHYRNPNGDHATGATGGEPGEWVHVHLGLYGTFVTSPTEDTGPPTPVGQVRLRIVGANHYSDLRGPTACAVITDAEKDAMHSRLGADPLRPDAEPSQVYDRLASRRVPIAQVLMDQAVIAGVGNVYRAEALFRAGLNPFLPARELPRPHWDALWLDLVALMREGVRTGRMETIRPEHADRTPPLPEHAPGQGWRHIDGRYVYRRHGQPCLLCGTVVRTDEVAARNLYWCPTCQPE